MNQLPTDTIQISPELLEVANLYLEHQNTQEVATVLNLEPHDVAQILKRPDVKSYINQVFFDLGFNNRFRMRRAMDALISQKFQELEESQTGSTKDISELLALSHKMSMELLDREIQLEKLRQGGPKNQVNVQINEGGDGTRYGQLIQKLLGDKLA
jgi:hypothetical protein